VAGERPARTLVMDVAGAAHRLKPVCRTATGRNAQPLPLDIRGPAVQP
jgi:hypothetical protein